MNKWTRFIDSCVGNIARKIQDEFDESKHPRDKSGKFTSKGNEGSGGASSEKTSTGGDNVLSELYNNGQGGVSKKEIRSVLNLLTDNEVDPEDTTTIKNVWEGAGIDPDRKDIKLTQQYLKNHYSKGGEGSGGSNYEHELKQERGRLENLQREAKKHGKGSDIHKRIAKSKASIANLEKLSGHGSTKESTNKKTKPVTMAWTGTEEDAERLAKKHGIDYKLVPGKGEDPYTYIELSGDNKKVKNFIVNEGFDGDEKEAKKWVPEAFNESGTSSSKSAKKVNAEASKHIHSALEDDIRQIAEESADKDEFKYNLEVFLEDYVQDDYADTDERAMDNFGYDKETVHAVAEEMKGEIDDIANDFFEEDDDDTSVTGPEDRDYMLEEDED